MVVEMLFLSGEGTSIHKPHILRADFYSLLGEVEVTLASTQWPGKPATHLWPPAQLKRAGTLGITDMQLFQNQVGQVERKANHTPI